MSTTSEASGTGYRVVVFALPDDLDEVTEAMAFVLGLHRTDANIHARCIPGTLPDRLSHETAERLAAGICATGAHAEVVAEADLPKFAEATTVHHVRCLDEGLDVLDLHGDRDALVRWPDVSLLAVGQVPQEMTRHFVDVGSPPIGAGRWTGPASVQMSLTPGPEAWLFCAHPERLLRIDHKRMNYEYLGVRKSDSATANFRIFLNDLVGRAACIYLTPATRTWLQSGSVEKYSFDSVEALERDTVLHVLIHRRVQQKRGDDSVLGTRSD